MSALLQDVVPSTSVGATLRGRHVLVTGFTGFLAKVVVARLLELVPDARVTLLTRGRGSVSAADRVAAQLASSPAFRALRAAWGPAYVARCEAQIGVLSGDVGAPGCGVDPAALAALPDVDLVLHSAGLTDFSPDPTKALAANVGGALHVADLAASLGAPLVHVSTCYVAGTRDGDVAESIEVGVAPSGAVFDPALELRAMQVALRARLKKNDRVAYAKERAANLGWPNIYTYTKGLAEHLLATRDDASICVVRPSIVECALAEPFAGWNEGLNTTGPLAWLISTAFRALPTQQAHAFDVIPVDLVARGLLVVMAAHLRGESPRIVQLASSDVNPLTFERAVELTGLGARRYARTGRVDGLQRLFAHLDPVPRADALDRALSVPNLRRFAQRAVRWLDEMDPPTPLEDAFAQLRQRAAKAEDTLRRVDGMLELYRPFILDYNWRFSTANARALTDALSPEERAIFGFDPTVIDWCTYWVDVEYPGLQQWSIPLLAGDKIPDDPAGALPRLTGAPRVSLGVSA